MVQIDVTTRLPAVVASFVNASNAGDGDAFLLTFADDAIVNDIQREFQGKAQISKWAEREIFAVKLTMEVQRAIDHYGDIILAAKLDGTYDKTNLPDPLIMTFYFTLRGEKITKLIILLNKPRPV